MNCNSEIHEELVKDGEIVCPFCDMKLIEYEIENKQEECCENKELINDNGMTVCQSCGIVDSYHLVSDCFGFYENMYRITRKSIYHRKYHIFNLINDIVQKNNVQINYNTREKILRIFALIDKVLPRVNGDRKRMINVKC